MGNGPNSMVYVVPVAASDNGTPIDHTQTSECRTLVAGRFSVVPTSGFHLLAAAIMKQESAATTQILRIRVD